MPGIVDRAAKVFGAFLTLNSATLAISTFASSTSAPGTSDTPHTASANPFPQADGQAGFSYAAFGSAAPGRAEAGAAPSSDSELLERAASLALIDKEGQAWLAKIQTEDPKKARGIYTALGQIVDNPQVCDTLFARCRVLLDDAAERFSLPGSEGDSVRSAAMLSPIYHFRLLNGPLYQLVDLTSLKLENPEHPQFAWTPTASKLQALIDFRQSVLGDPSARIPLALPWDEAEVRSGFATACEHLRPNQLVRLATLRNQFALEVVRDKNWTNPDVRAALRAWDIVIFGAISRSSSEIQTTHSLQAAMPLIEATAERIKAGSN